MPPTELVAPTELLELVLSLPVVKGSCADATDESESNEANLEGVGMDARFLSASGPCPSVGELVREDELLPG